MTKKKVFFSALFPLTTKATPSKSLGCFFFFFFLGVDHSDCLEMGHKCRVFFFFFF
eukprot:NODE_1202_length_1038_cov_49.865521_g831_i0.p3 GENE.NODE_1202_length_1038_cov_49.865521_g831_i0~~NODE_1202_length_1038_cov_49.865521_g831_i0.p3  ORF type:complete len:56 (-),score=38.04 NODE_1202_length_1038_cov_49.865521_g831_i0:413-580(-)